MTSENITSFDLHVLSTPPALILSQDRTLMFKSPDPVRLKLSFFSFRYCVASISRWLLGSFMSVFQLPCSNVLNNPRGFSTSVSFETFKRIFRVGYTVQLSRFFCLLSSLADSSLTISQFLLFVNSFFNFFFQTLFETVFRSLEERKKDRSLIF